MDTDGKRLVSQREPVEMGCRYPQVDGKVACELDADGG